MTSTEPADDVAYDGRRARRDRNTEAVLRACWQLFMEGELRPTAQQVADRSGVSLRSVFRHFQNLDTLLRAAIDWYLEHNAHLFLFTPPPAGASFDERVDALASYRLRLYRECGRQIGAGIALAGTDQVIGARVDASRHYLADSIRSLFAPEIAALGDEAGRAAAAAAHAVLGVQSWQILNQEHGLDDEQIGRWYRAGIREAFGHAGANRE